MKTLIAEVGESKSKTELGFLWDKTHTRVIIIRYDFEELARITKVLGKEREK